MTTQARTGETLCDRIDALIAERSLLKHPFYTKWQVGELTVDSLKGYACQYYHHVLQFPTYVSGAHANCDDLPDRQELLENLVEEEQGPNNHPELWLRFGEAVGLSREEIIESSTVCAGNTWRRRLKEERGHNGRRSALEITFLGSGNAFAADGRYWSSFLVDKKYLFDAPPTLLPHLKQLRVPLPDIEVIFLTHHHGDHFMGVPFLFLEYLYMTERSNDLYIVGPPGVREWIEDFAPEHMGLDDVKVIRKRIAPETMMVLTHLGGQPHLDGLPNVVSAADLKTFRF